MPEQAIQGLLPRPAFPSDTSHPDKIRTAVWNCPALSTARCDAHSRSAIPFSSVLNQSLPPPTGLHPTPAGGGASPCWAKAKASNGIARPAPLPLHLYKHQSDVTDSKKSSSQASASACVTK
jgi:hypothetical protein